MPATIAAVIEPVPGPTSKIARGPARRLASDAMARAAYRDVGISAPMLVYECWSCRTKYSFSWIVIVTPCETIYKGLGRPIVAHAAWYNHIILAQKTPL